MPESAAITRRFNEPDELREFPLGRFELVIGDEPYVSIHFLGADDYATK